MLFSPTIILYCSILSWDSQTQLISLNLLPNKTFYYNNLKNNILKYLFQKCPRTYQIKFQSWGSRHFLFYSETIFKILFRNILTFTSSVKSRPPRCCYPESGIWHASRLRILITRRTPRGRIFKSAVNDIRRWSPWLPFWPASLESWYYGILVFRYPGNLQSALSKESPSH